MTPQDVPVALLIFNRPSAVARVLARLEQVRPKKLLIVADGPRTSREGILCRAAREMAEDVTWECEVLRNYSEANLGCRHRVASGLQWVFEQCEEAIVMEDDCVPHLDFFSFCAEMLGRYREDRRVMAINGSNFLRGGRVTQDSYHFSHHPHVWGWATWRRAWEGYDPAMKTWAAEQGRVLAQLPSEPEREFWRKRLESAADGSMDTWDYQWYYHVWRNGGCAATPAVNLISNIGFGPDASHTFTDWGFANLPVGKVDAPLRHPAEVQVQRAADARLFREFYQAQRAGRGRMIVELLRRTWRRLAARRS